MMNNIDELDQSPIEEDQAMISSEEQEEETEHEAIDCETFKGSFLLEMEKLTRPLTFEKGRYNIYSLQYAEEDENILGFIEEPQQDQNHLTFQIQESQCEQYIIDFQEENCPQCTCTCHKINKQQPQSLHRRNSDTKLCEREEKGQKIPILQKFEQRRDKKWTAISLKEYKQHIKKKLQQKR